ncbi:MAG: response regulator [Oligoflexales bacterium]|nr:response regulator [Oligoflexales bacterium]
MTKMSKAIENMALPILFLFAFALLLTDLEAAPHIMTEQQLILNKNIIFTAPDSKVENWVKGFSKDLSPITINSNDYQITLSKYSDYLEDSSGKMGLLDIINNSQRKNHWISRKTDDVPSFGLSESSFWFRYLVVNKDPSRTHFLFEISYPYLDYIEFFSFSRNGGYRAVKTGDQYPYGQRMVDHHNFAFPIEMEKGESALILIRLQAIDPIIFPAKIWDPDLFNSEKSRELTILGIYYGMLAVMIFYNLFLFVTILDKAYAVYVIYAISFILFQAAQNGLGSKHIWPNNTFMANFGTYIFLSFVNFWLTFFTQIFLQTGKNHRFLHRILNFVFYPWIIMGFVLSMKGAKISHTVLLTLQPVGSVALMATGIVSLFKGYRPARFYVLAFSTLLLGAVLLALRQLGILPSNILTEYGAQIGSAAELVLLSFALGDKISLEQEEARRNIEELNNSLERKVEEKTNELSVANQKLREMDKNKTNFFQNISHELRTPLTLILNLLERASETDPSSVDISVALKNSKRLLRLMNQLLDFQKHAVASPTLKLEPVNLTRFLMSVGDYFKEAVKKRNIEFKLKINDIDGDGEYFQNIYINGQIDALEKIVFNYLSNAFKYVQNYGKITLLLQSIENKAIISVTDDGAGISDEDQKRLFKLFSQADETGSKPYEGTGIGLALSKELAEKMMGRVEVSSTLGRGSCFSAIFPILRIELPVIDLALIITENNMTQDEIHNLAVSMPEPLTVKNFSDLLELNKVRSKFIIQCLICDEMMLGVYGNQALKEICESNPYLRVIILRSSEGMNPAAELKTMGINAEELPPNMVFSEIAENILKSLFENKKRKSELEESEHKIKDWLLADIEDSPGAEDMEDPDKNSGEAKNLQGGHILVVDDNVDLLRLITGYLKDENFQVSTAINGIDAIKKCKKRKPDLIISDWMMPVMSGPEFIQNIKNDKIFSAVPVILLTARSEETTRKEGTSFGADGFLGKPFDHMELISLVRNLLKLKQGEMEIATLNREIADSVLKRFLPPELIESILKGESVFDKKPKYTKITILAVTLSHFKEYIGEISPSDTSDILNKYYTEVTNIIFSHKGIIDRFEDGSIRALFGVPKEEDPELQIEKACWAALDIEKRLLEALPIWSKNIDVSLGYKVVIHFGEALVGTIGSALRTDYTAIGASILFVRHIEELAKDGDLLISKDARDYLRTDMWVRYDNPVMEGNDKKLTLARIVNPQTPQKNAV